MRENGSMRLNEIRVMGFGTMMAICCGFQSSLDGEVASRSDLSLAEERKAEGSLAYSREEVGVHTPDAQPQAARSCPLIYRAERRCLINSALPCLDGLFPVSLPSPMDGLSSCSGLSLNIRCFRYIRYSWCGPARCLLEQADWGRRGL